MSAYLCDPHHIGALAAFAVSGENYAITDLTGTDKQVTIAKIAAELALENIRSVSARYPNDKSGGRPGPANMTDDVYQTAAIKHALAYYTRPPRLIAVDYLKMCQGYRYQACETGHFDETLAGQQIRAIISKAINQLPEYDDAPWEFHGEVPEHKAMKEAAIAVHEYKKTQLERECDELRAKHPELVVGHGQVIAAKNMRKELKAAFPDVKFSVRSDSFSGGDSVNISWTDGPLVSDVDAIVSKYKYGRFNGYDDSYEYYENAWIETFGSTKYVSTSRNYSPELITKAIQKIADDWDKGCELPTAEEFSSGKLFCKRPGNSQENWQTLIHQYAYKM